MGNDVIERHYLYTGRSPVGLESGYVRLLVDLPDGKFVYGRIIDNDENFIVLFPAFYHPTGDMNKAEAKLEIKLNEELPKRIGIRIQKTKRISLGKESIKTIENLFD